MRAIRKTLARLGGGKRRYTVPALALAVCMLVGYLGATAHAVEHFSDSQPESICHLCIAGDQFTPVARKSPSGIVATTSERLLPHAQIIPPVRRLTILHGVRAPPLTA